MDKEPTEEKIGFSDSEFEDIAGAPEVSEPTPQGPETPEPVSQEQELEPQEPSESVPQESQESAPQAEAVTTFPSDPVEQMERAADIAEQDAEDIRHLKKVAENKHPVVATPAEESQSSQPVDVRQDFIDQMHQPKSKSKIGTGKKAAIAILVVIILGLAGFFTWWFAYYSQPKVALAGALKQLVVADDVNVGMILKTTGEDLGGETTNSEIILTSNFHNLTESSHFLAINNVAEDTNSGDTDEASGSGLTAEARMLDDGTVYVKLDNLDAFETKYNANGENTETNETAATMDNINGKWYQLNIEDILQFLGVDQATAQPIADFYHCSIAVAGQDYSRDLIELYKQHPFLMAERSEEKAFTNGATAYNLSVDYEALADFLNALPNLGAMESFYVCYNTMAESLGNDEISAESFTEYNAEDLEIALSSNYDLQIEISNFRHELVRISARNNDGDTQQGLTADFAYQYEEITVPDEYWTAEDLVAVMQDYITMLFAQMSTVNTYDDPDIDEGEDENDWYDDDGWYLGEDLYDDEDDEDEE